MFEIYQRPASKPDAPSGLVAGALLTAALIAVSYSAWRAAGLPFLPFDVFDWIVQALPGFMVTLGIDSMISLFGALGLGTTAGGAKAAGQTMAILGMWLAGAVAGGCLFKLLRLWRSKFAIVLGAVAGVSAGAIAALVSRPASYTAMSGGTAGNAWIVAAFSFWGLALGWSYRRERVSRVMRMERRQFMAQFGAVTAAVTVAGVTFGKLLAARRDSIGGARWSELHAPPNANAAVKPAARTRPELTPLEEHYRSDINTIMPSIRQEDWRLEILGLCSEPLTMTLDELRNAYEPMDQFVTLSCISNPVAGDLIGTQRWTGVSLARLLPAWRLLPEATHLKIRSADGFFEIVSVESIRSDDRVMLAYAWDGLPLSRAHGFPLRIYIPDTYGMKQPKWIVSIEAIDHWEPGYWVLRGWSAQANVRAASVIDTIGAGMMIAQARTGSLVPIGGMAYAGARGISRVEVRVDDGPWMEAELRDPLSPQAWTLWRLDWPLRRGLHTFTVRSHGCCAAAERRRRPAFKDDAVLTIQGLFIDDFTGRELERAVRLHDLAF
jgi:DMSO/TMAO reductase YedYZ molybdopterin-dependent catalytic subunit